MIPPMRRLARHAFAALATLSLLLCMAVCVLWVRSRHWEETPVITAGNRLAQAYARAGAAHLYLSWGIPKDGELLRECWSKHTSSDPARTFEGMFGFAPSLCLQAPSASQLDLVTDPELATGFHYVHLPLWLPAMLTFLFPGWWFYGRHLKKHRAKRGLCPTCGYDLRASPHRCPECGARSTAWEVA